MKIIIAKDFTDTPGGRFKAEGNFSGELFREEFLLPQYLDAKSKHEKLQVDFDGGYGYAPSFLEEAFGGLVRTLHGENILNNIDLISSDEPEIINKIKKYVNDAMQNC